MSQDISTQITSFLMLTSVSLFQLKTSISNPFYCGQGEQLNLFHHLLFSWGLNSQSVFPSFRLNKLHFPSVMFSKSLLIFPFFPGSQQLACPFLWCLLPETRQSAPAEALSALLQTSRFLVLLTLVIFRSAITVTAGHQQGRDSASESTASPHHESSRPLHSPSRYCSLIAGVILALDGKIGITQQYPGNVLD